MSDGKKLVASILERGSVSALRGLEPALFEADERPLFEFVKAHYRRYRELPTIETVETELRQRLPVAEEAVDYYLKKLYDRRTFTLLRDDFSDLRSNLQSFDVDAARETIARMHMVCRTTTPGNDVRNLRQAADAVLRLYQEAHLNPGVTGVPTGWPRLDHMLGGYQAGDLISWIARLGIGKTNLLLYQAFHAWMLGYNILFVTMEMTIEQIARRALGIPTLVNPEFIRKGALCSYSHNRLSRYIETMSGADRFTLFAGSFSKKVSDVEILMHEIQPDIVYIDGGYILRSDTKGFSNRTEKIAATFDALKQLTITTERPIVVTSQFSRQAGKAGKDGSIETIGFTEAIAQHSSIVFGVKEGEPPFTANRRVLEIMKGREGESGKYLVNYRFDPVNFNEVEEEEIRQESTNLDWMVAD